MSPSLTVRERRLSVLGTLLRDHGYTFVTTSPATHARVDRRHGEASPRPSTLRDVFGFSRSFREEDLPAAVVQAAREAEVLVPDGSKLRSSVRFSTRDDLLFVHSAYPTAGSEDVFFGPDTYRFCSLVEQELGRQPSAHLVVDVGCGTGAGGLAAAPFATTVCLTDVLDAAASFARVNVALAGNEHIQVVVGNLFDAVDGRPDVVLANPPYMLDTSDRTYRHGGGELGEQLAVDVAAASLERLVRNGKLILYTGSAIVGGRDLFLEAVRKVLPPQVAWSYRELDPDVFGEEIETNDAYAEVERIAAVALVARKS